MVEFLTHPTTMGAIGGAMIAAISGYLAIRSRPTRKVQNQQVLVDAAEDVVQLQRQAILDLNEQLAKLKAEMASIVEKHRQEVSAMKGSLTKLKNRVESLEKQVRALGHEPVAESEKGSD